LVFGATSVVETPEKFSTHS